VWEVGKRDKRERVYYSYTHWSVYSSLFVRSVCLCFCCFKQVVAVILRGKLSTVRPSPPKMSRRSGAVFLSSLRLLLAPRYTAVRQLELKNGLRLTPVTATSFAIVVSEYTLYIHTSHMHRCM